MVFLVLGDSIPKRCKGLHGVDLGESFPTSIYLQNFSCARISGFPLFSERDRTYLLACLLASIQPRTSLIFFFLASRELIFPYVSHPRELDTWVFGHCGRRRQCRERASEGNVPRRLPGVSRSRFFGGRSRVTHAYLRDLEQTPPRRSTRTTSGRFQKLTARVQDVLFQLESRSLFCFWISSPQQHHFLYFLLLWMCIQIQGM